MTEIRLPWPHGAGRVRRPVPIRFMWLWGLDRSPASQLPLVQILALPGAWRILQEGMQQNPPIWTDQPPKGATAPGHVRTVIDQGDITIIGYV